MLPPQTLTRSTVFPSQSSQEERHILIARSASNAESCLRHHTPSAVLSQLLVSVADSPKPHSSHTAKRWIPSNLQHQHTAVGRHKLIVAQQLSKVKTRHIAGTWRKLPSVICRSKFSSPPANARCVSASFPGTFIKQRQIHHLNFTIRWYTRFSIGRDQCSLERNTLLPRDEQLLSNSNSAIKRRIKPEAFQDACCCTTFQSRRRVVHVSEDKPIKGLFHSQFKKL